MPRLHRFITLIAYVCIIDYCVFALYQSR